MSLTTWTENEIKDQWFEIYFMHYAEQQHIRLLLQYNWHHLY